MDCQSNDIEQKITSLQHKLQCGSYNCTSGKSKYSHIRQIYLKNMQCKSLFQYSVRQMDDIILKIGV